MMQPFRAVFWLGSPVCIASLAAPMGLLRTCAKE